MSATPCWLSRHQIRGGPKSYANNLVDGRSNLVAGSAIE
jgi:hypothetical protein